MCLLWFVLTQCCIPRRIEDENGGYNTSTKRKGINESLFEEDPSGKPVIDVKNLRKVFRSITGRKTYYKYIWDTYIMTLIL